jgi:hypothetical protein
VEGAKGPGRLTTNARATASTHQLHESWQREEVNLTLAAVGGDAVEPLPPATRQGQQKKTAMQPLYRPFDPRDTV